MRKINELSGFAILLFLIMLVEYYIEDRPIKILLLFSSFFVTFGVIGNKIKRSEGKRRGYLKG